MACMIGSDMVQDAGRDAGGATPAASWLADARADSPLPLVPRIFGRVHLLRPASVSMVF